MRTSVTNKGVENNLSGGTMPPGGEGQLFLRKLNGEATSPHSDSPYWQYPGWGRRSLMLSEIAIWRVMLDEQSPESVQQLGALLSADELERARRFHFQRDRRRYEVGRGALRMLIGQYLGQAPQEIAFNYGPNGKPSVDTRVVAPEGEGSAALNFNVAHSEGRALFAFSRGCDVGVDVEFMRDVPEWERLADSWFSPRDVARLAGTRPELRRAEFFRLWTRTEALLKATGAGLGSLSRTAANHHVYTLHLEPGFSAALAASMPVESATLHLWQHEPRLPFGGQQRSQRIRLEDSSAVGANFL
jgi:4'-phosphopantetheinyl transferase